MFAVINAAPFVAWILIILPGAMTGAIFGCPLPAALPVWGALLIALIDQLSWHWQQRQASLPT